MVGTVVRLQNSLLAEIIFSHVVFFQFLFSFSLWFTSSEFSRKFWGSQRKTDVITSCDHLVPADVFVGTPVLNDLQVCKQSGGID